MPILQVPVRMQTLLKQRFDRFHAANPWVWERFEKYTLELIARGVKHYGSKTIWEHMRYMHDLQTESTDGLKLNNNYTPYYARLFKQEHPGHSDFFSFRKIRGEISQDPPSQHII